MHDVVQISDELAVGEVSLGVENKPVKAVLRQGKEEKSGHRGEDGIGKAEGLPGGQVVEHKAYHQEGEEGN